MGLSCVYEGGREREATKAAKHAKGMRVGGRSSKAATSSLLLSFLCSPQRPASPKSIESLFRPLSNLPDPVLQDREDDVCLSGHLLKATALPDLPPPLLSLLSPSPLRSPSLPVDSPPVDAARSFTSAKIMLDPVGVEKGVAAQPFLHLFLIFLRLEIVDERRTLRS